MFSARKLTVVVLAPPPEPTDLVARMRLSVSDKALAQLIEELEPHLPKSEKLPVSDI